MATMKGRLRAKTSPITPQGRPFPTSAPNFLAIWLRSMRLVSAPSAKQKGRRQLAEQVATEQAHDG